MKGRIIGYLLLGLGALSALFAFVNVTQDWFSRSALLFLPLTFFLAALTLNAFLERRAKEEKKGADLLWIGCGLVGTVGCLLGFLLNLFRA